LIRTVYVVHHSHTDIGYTHGQSRIVHWHREFIRQAMRIAARREGFSWTCETLYPVEQFWQTATEEERRTFISLVKAGRLGLTAGYLHFNELPDAPLLEALAQRARGFESDGLAVDAAMHADINGCPLIQARALVKAGVRFLLMCVHPHHGYVPFGRRQELFRWDLGYGQELIVCHGDHYHTGNELGLAPGGEANYTAGFTDPPKPFDDDVLERRLPAYLRKLEASGWTHDFAVICVSGLITDNSPPSELVADRIARWNQKHGAEIRIEMTTPSRIAQVIAPIAARLPVYSGDWPDWWSDGVAGDAEAVALFRHAQRERRWLVALGAGQRQPKADGQQAGDSLEAIDQPLALFAEHTFGHSASVRAPWNLLAQQLRLKKLGFAADAADRAQAMLDQSCESIGGGALAYDQPPKYRVTNPFSRTMRDLVALETEYGEAQRWGLTGALRVVNCATGEILPHQPASSLRGLKLIVDLTLAGGQSIDLAIEPADKPAAEIDVRPIVPDHTRDVRVNDTDVPPTTLRTDHVEIRWSAPQGIVGWTDLATGRELIDRTAGALPFTVVASRLSAELTGTAQCTKRRRLGRNRNGATAGWATSRLARILPGERGDLCDGVVLDYEMEGFELLQVKLNAHRRQPRVDVEVIAHKLGTWDVENVYLALPFTSGHGAQLWLDRGEPIRPGQDQLPGTLLDYMGVQDGLAWCGPEMGVAVAQWDSHLVQLGPLNYGVRTLAGEQPPGWQPSCVYAWLMTNYWETNFAPELGGFYSFRYSILWGRSLTDPREALSLCRDVTTSLRAIRLRG